MESEMKDVWARPVSCALASEVQVAFDRQGQPVFDKVKVVLGSAVVGIKGEEPEVQLVPLDKKCMSKLYNLMRGAKPPITRMLRAAQVAARNEEAAKCYDAATKTCAPTPGLKAVVDTIVNTIQGYGGAPLRFRFSEGGADVGDGDVEGAEGEEGCVGVVTSRFCHVPIPDLKLALDGALAGFVQGEPAVRENRYGNPILWYKVGNLPAPKDAAGRQIGLSGRADYYVRVNTGTNTGFAGFHVDIGAVVLVCGNGMTVRKLLAKAYAKHTRAWFMAEKETAPSIIQKVCDDAVMALNSVGVVDRLMDEAAKTPLPLDRLQLIIRGLYSRGILSRVMARTIIERMKEQTASEGETLWALCQALSFTGTHHEELSDGVRESLAALSGRVLVDKEFVERAATDGEKTPLEEVMEVKPRRRKVAEGAPGAPGACPSDVNA